MVNDLAYWTHTSILLDQLVQLLALFLVDLSVNLWIICSTTRIGSQWFSNALSNQALAATTLAAQFLQIAIVVTWIPDKMGRETQGTSDNLNDHFIGWDLLMGLHHIICGYPYIDSDK